MEALFKVLFILLFCASFFTAIFTWAGAPQDIYYAKGYIDAMNGVPSYELIENDRGETVWVGSRPKSDG